MEMSERTAPVPLPQVLQPLTALRPRVFSGPCQAVPGCSGSHSRLDLSSHSDGDPGTASHTWHRQNAEGKERRGGWATAGLPQGPQDTGRGSQLGRNDPSVGAVGASRAFCFCSSQSRVSGSPGGFQTHRAVEGDAERPTLPRGRITGVLYRACLALGTELRSLCR